MKKVLHISKYYFPICGGTEQVAKDCVSALKDICEQKVFCFNEEKQDLFDSVDEVEVIRAGCFSKILSQSLSLSYGRLLREAINNFAPDIIIFHYPNPFAAAFLLKYIPENCKLIVYWHLDIVKQKYLKFLFVQQNNKLLERADKVIATSPNYMEESPYLSKYRKKCVVIPNCISEERLVSTEKSKTLTAQILKDNKGKIICFAVGRHVPYKGLTYLIQASKYLDDRFRIYIGGQGPLTEELKAEAKGDEKIKFLGRISDEELFAWYSAMDIFCFPSITKNEAFGIALAEAMYFGKPAVTFTIPGSGVNYVCVNRENGIEVPNQDIKAYAEAMKKLADDEELRNRLGQAGKQRVEENFMFRQFKTILIDLFQNLSLR